MRCPSCAHENWDQAKFCSKCGATLESPEAEKPTAEEPTAEEPTAGEPTPPKPLEPSAPPGALGLPIAEPSKDPRKAMRIALVAGAIAVVLLGVAVPAARAGLRELRIRGALEDAGAASAAERADAARTLGTECDPRGLEPLVRLVGDEDGDVREAAAQALPAFGEEAVDPLCEAIGDLEPEAMPDAIAALEAVAADQAVVDSLCSLLGHSDPAVRLEAVERLAELVIDPAVYDAGGAGTTRYRALLGALPGESSAGVRAAICAALGELAGPGDTKAVPLLARRLLDKDAAVRKAAFNALEQFGGGAAYQMICAAGDTRVRSRLVTIVGRMGSSASRGLVAALKHKRTGVRIAAIQGVQRTKYKGDDAVRLLIVRLRDPDATVRGVAADALGSIGDRDAVVPLVDGLCSEGSRAVRVKMAKALVKVRGPAIRIIAYVLRDRDLRGVKNNYKMFIKWGFRSTESIMCDAVLAHGYPTMVVDYLNCGSSALDAAARRWCSRHGYRVVTRSGVGYSGPRWGSQS